MEKTQAEIERMIKQQTDMKKRLADIQDMYKKQFPDSDLPIPTRR
jgi:flagellar capping protein FliD